MLITEVKIIELHNSSLKTKLEDITKNVSNFNKGREKLYRITENSRFTFNKKGLVYDNKSKARFNKKKLIKGEMTLNLINHQNP